MKTEVPRWEYFNSLVPWGSQETLEQQVERHVALAQPRRSRHRNKYRKIFRDWLTEPSGYYREEK